MIHFPDTTLKRYILNSNGKGVYGETVNQYKFQDEIIVDFQNENNQELAHEYGVDLQNLYKIYVDLSVPLNDTDKFIDNDNHVYHIIGNIRKYRKFHNYQKANLVLERNTRGVI